MAIIFLKKNITSIGKDVEKFGPSHIAGRNVKWWKTERQFLKKLNMELPRDPSVPLLSACIPKESKTGAQILVRVFIVALLTMPRCPLVDEWANCGLSLCKGYYSTTKVTEVLINPTTWMNLRNIMLGGRGRAQRVTYRTYDSISMRLVPEDGGRSLGEGPLSA